MMQNKNIFLFFLFISAFFTACIDDGFTSSPNDQPFFSTDTLNMGRVFTAEQTATHRFTVYNPHNKGLNISNIAMTGANASMFRLNVDGMSGKTFQNIEIRANDSIFVFVSADLPETGQNLPQRIEATLDFTTNNVISSVVIAADGQDINRICGDVISEDTTFKAGKPYQVKDSLVVAENTTLTLEPGTVIWFHDNAVLRVYGSLLSQGTPENPVLLTGDRMGNVITNVSFDLMSRQWGGVDFMETSHSNVIEFTEISNTSYGVTVMGDGQDIQTKKLTLINSKLRNSGDCVLTALGASVEAYGCEFAEASNSLVVLLGGNHRFDQCTASNHYLFSAVSGASWMIGDVADTEYDFLPTQALITNCITWGLGSDVYPGDLTGTEVYFKRCLFKAAGTDDDNFQDSLWDSDPLFYTVRSDYIFDYRLKPDSPAIGKAYGALSDYKLEMDYYGEKRNNDLGAYVYVAPAE